MLRMTITAAMLIAISFAAPRSAYAQQERRGERMAQLAELLKEKLQLTEDQSERIEDIINKAQEDISRDRQELQGDRRMIMEALRGRLEAMYERIAELLTDSQKEELSRLRKEFEEQSRMRRGGQGRF